jgi:hypothetical protein
MKRLKGIFTDCQPIDQPEGTYRNARNIEINTSLGAIVSESGNTAGITINGIILGSLLLPTGNTLLFVKNTSDNFKILEVSNTGTLANTHLDTTLPTGDYVQATFNINAQGKTVIYWVDGINPPYFLVLGNTTQTALPETLFPQINSFAYFTNAYSLTTGGNLKSGTYYFALAYVDEDGNQTSFFNVSNPVSVTQKLGEGSKANIPTASSIGLNITGIDTSYKKLCIVVIPQYDKVIGEVLQLPDINISTSTLSYIYNGSETTTISSLNDIIIDAPNYSVAKTITTSNSRLYLGNLESDEDLDYQKYAKDITVTCVRNENDYNLNSSPSYKTFKGDEVYALYIAWVLKNGKLSKAFHIPGRQATDIQNVPSQPAIYELTIDKGVDTSTGTNFSLDITIPSGYIASANFTMGLQIVRNGNPQQTFTTENIFVPFSSNTSSILSQLKTAIEGIPNTGFAGNISSNVLTITSSTFAGNSFSVNIFPVSNITSGNRDDIETIPQAFFDLQDSIVFNFTSYLSTPSSTYAVIQLNYSFGSISVNVARNDSVTDVYNKIKTAYEATSFQNYTLTISSGKLVITSNSNSNIFNNVNVIVDHQDTSLLFTQTLVQTSLGSDGIPVSAETGPGTVFNKRYKEVSIPHPTLKTGYWENENETYPNDSVTWGALANTPVRHHKFPDASTAEYTYQNNNKIVQFGIQLGNIQVPQEIKDKVLGYKVFYAKRTDENRTILDTGVAHPTIIHTDGDRQEIRPANYFSSFGGVSTQTIHIQSVYPFNLLHSKKPIASVSHIKVIGSLNNEISNETVVSNTTFRATTIAGINSYSNTIKPLLAKSYVDFNEQDTLVLNPGFSPTNFRMDRTESRVLIQTNSSQEFTNQIQLVNFLTPKDNLYTSFEQQFLVDTGYYQAVTSTSTVGSSPIFNGDTYVSEFKYKTSFARDREYYVQINNTLISSEDDIYLRVYGDKQWQSNVRNFSNTVFAAPRWTAERGFIWSYQEGSREGIEAINNFIDYNNDYSSLSTIKPAFTYNSDTDRTVFNTRIIRNVDSPLTFRTFRPDDYIDLTSNRGELVKLTNYNNILIPHLQRALVRTKGQEELQVNDIRAFLGTGDIFSVRPDELIYTEEGFAGIQDFNHSISTPFGYVFIDKQSRKLFRLDNDGLAEISNNGLYNYFYDNIPNMTDIKFGYDPKLKRVLFSNSVDTMSYYPEFNSWMSFHNYQPDFMFRTYDKFFTTKTNKLYLHNTANYTLYGNTLPMVYSFTDNTASNVSKIVDSVTIIGEVKDANGQVDRIINTIKLSNSTQETDVIDIVNNNPFEYINTTRKTKNEWNINKFRATTSVTGDYSWAYKKRIEDKFVNVDITFTSGTDRIYIYGILVNFKPSIR